MLEVGRMPGGLVEDRTHFGAWCVTSSPLILGYDLRDGATTDRVWPVIANTEAIAVNQVWAGHPGRRVRVDSLTGVELWMKPLSVGAVGAVDATQTSTSTSDGNADARAAPAMGKVGKVGKVAAFLLNPGTERVAAASFDISELGFLPGTTVNVRDIWEHRDVGLRGPMGPIETIGGAKGRIQQSVETTHTVGTTLTMGTTTVTADLAGHDSAFFTLTPQ